MLARLPGIRETYLRSFPKLFSATLQIVDPGELPFFAERIREREQATLPVETGAEAFLDNYGLHRVYLSFSQEIVTAAGHFLGERQGVATWSFRVRRWGKRGQLWLIIIIVFGSTLAYVEIGIR